MIFGIILFHRKTESPISEGIGKKRLHVKDVLSLQHDAKCSEIRMKRNTNSTAELIY